MDEAVRKAGVPAEATQELQAIDVLEVVETAKAKAAQGKLGRRTPSASSIAPVGLDFAPHSDAQDEEVNPTMEIRLPVKRRSLRGVVIGAVAGCALILVAAGIARVGHASSEEPAAAKLLPTTSTVTTATPLTNATTAPGATPVPAATAGATWGPQPDANAAGTVRLDKPAVVGHVWLDGKKLTSSSAVVRCGSHKIKVGHGRTHAIDVPCGGEVGIYR